jgi:hypothetical protein
MLVMLHSSTVARRHASWDEAAPRLRPRLRGAAFLDLRTLETAAHQQGLTPAAQEIAPGLYTTLVIDGEQSMTSVSHEMLARWGKSFEEADERARQNLSAISHDDFFEAAEGVWLAPWDDAYAASRLLLPHVLSRVAVDPLVAIPNRDTLLVAQRSPSAIGALVDAIDDLSEPDSYTITRRIFSLSGTTLEPFDLDATHPSAVSHHNGYVRELVRDYGEQQAALSHSLDETVYAASIAADEGRDGRLSTRALWTRGVDTLLPQVDRVHLMWPEERDGEPISSRIWVTSWAALAAMEGALTPTRHRLPRFRTGVFPEGAALERCAVPVEHDRRIAEIQ